MRIEGRLCRKCGREIGRENYVLICDKISKHLHTFHAACQPVDPDVQRHHGMFCEPGLMLFTGSALGWKIVKLPRWLKWMNEVYGRL